MSKEHAMSTSELVSKLSELRNSMDIDLIPQSVKEIMAKEAQSLEAQLSKRTIELINDAVNRYVENELKHLTSNLNYPIEVTVRKQRRSNESRKRVIKAKLLNGELTPSFGKFSELYRHLNGLGIYHPTYERGNSARRTLESLEKEGSIGELIINEVE